MRKKSAPAFALALAIAIAFPAAAVEAPSRADIATRALALVETVLAKVSDALRRDRGRPKNETPTGPAAVDRSQFGLEPNG